jgi:ligand-binding SRPBCC domain-containing protein
MMCASSSSAIVFVVCAVVPTKPVVIEFASMLDAPCEQVWRRISTAAGVNAELWPIQMRFPRRLESLDCIAPGGAPVGSLISLLGVVPIDWHRLTLVSITPNGGFHELSSSLWMRHWRHERRLEPCSSKCLLRDRVELIARLAPLTSWLAPIYQAVFARRHQRLRASFGGQPVTSR